MSNLDDFKPTAEQINRLPEPLRNYIHDLETLCDPAGMVQDNASLREQNEQMETLLNTRLTNTGG